MYGYYRVASAMIATEVANTVANAKQIVSLIDEANDRIVLLLFSLNFVLLDTQLVICF